MKPKAIVTAYDGAISVLQALLLVLVATPILLWNTKSNAANPPIQSDYVTWLNNLQSQGYIETQGEVTTFVACPPYVNALGSCFGNNSASPYIFIQPPFSPGDYQPSYAQSAPFESSDHTSDTLWQLGPNEAIVTIITLPPQAAYFGFETYMVERNPVNYGGTDPGTSCTVAAGTPSNGHIETKD